MAAEEYEAFWQWVNEERTKRRLSYRAMEGTVGTPSGWLHRRASKRLPPTLDHCRAIAQSFGLPLDVVMRRAGLLPGDDESPELARLRALASGLNEDNLRTLVAVAEALSGNQARTYDQGYFRIVGFPDLARSSLEAWEHFTAGLSTDELALLTRALGLDAAEAPPES